MIRPTSADATSDEQPPPAQHQGEAARLWRCGGGRHGVAMSNDSKVWRRNDVHEARSDERRYRAPADTPELDGLRTTAPIGTCDRRRARAGRVRQAASLPRFGERSGEPAAAHADRPQHEDPFVSPKREREEGRPDFNCGIGGRRELAAAARKDRAGHDRRVHFRIDAHERSMGRPGKLLSGLDQRRIEVPHDRCRADQCSAEPA